MQNVLMPFRFKHFGRAYRRQPVRVLDVGCGSHSPTITKRWWPNCTYYGIDRENYGNDAADYEAMERFFQVDLATEPLDVVPDDFFDVAFLSHVIEHLPNGLEVVRQVTAKLRAGGRIYVEFPSVRSLALPSMYGTLQFCDDPTHVRVYDVREVANVLLAEGFKVLKAGTRRDRLRVLLFPLFVPVKYLLRRRLNAGDFWDLTGFASYVYAARPHKPVE